MTAMERAFPNRMNPTDALFWLLDKIPDLRSTIGALLILERVPARQRIHEEFERLSGQLVRMRQRVAEVPFGLAPPEWIEDPQFDCDYHLRYLAAPAPGGMDDLLEEISPFYATAFDPERPLWEAYVVEGLADGRGALFIKMHHCLTDGVGGAQLSDMLLSDRSATSKAIIRAVSDRRSSTPIAMLWRAALYNLNDAVQVSRTALGWAATAALAPTTILPDVSRAIRAVAGFGQELVVPRAESPLHHRRSLSRRLSTFEMSLREIDAVRGKLSATNNDLVLTIVSGAMHRWHTSRGADTRELRTLVPVSLRRPGDVSAGNRLALLALTLPVGEPNPLRRLQIIQDRMGQVKSDRRAALYPLLARLMVAMPLALAKQIGRQQTTRTNFVCTNVPGPRRLCYLAGAPIEKIYPYAPLVGDHPVAIALYSYRDTMFVGLDVDPLAMDDLPRFRDMMQESYDEILNVGRQAPRAAARSGRRGHRR
ncbi:MAG TPA: wax ester/triacylglycerol synthase family O-acyltransferase [Candidatus Binatia bacterium]